MIYSNRTKEQILKRVYILVIIGAVVGMAIGAGAMYLVKVNGTQIANYGDSSNWRSNAAIKKWESAEKYKFKKLDSVGLGGDLQEFIYCMSNSSGIDYAFTLGLIKTESDFTDNLVSDTDDYGLFQINTVNHEKLQKALKINDFLNPYENTRGAMYILSHLFNKYESPEKVLMAYNLGETGAKTLWDKGVYETPYVIKVMNNAKQFANELKGSK